MECVDCGSAAISERRDRTAQGCRRFRCRDCGREFNERSGGVLNRTQYPSDVIALVVLWRLRYRRTLQDLSETFLQRCWCSPRTSARRTCTTASARRRSLAAQARANCRAWSWPGPTAPARARSPAGWQPSAAGVSRCRATASTRAWRHGLEERPKGFQVVPRRWVVESTLAWSSRSRRLARDYERLPETGEAMIHAAMSRIMLRRAAA